MFLASPVKPEAAAGTGLSAEGAECPACSPAGGAAGLPADGAGERCTKLQELSESPFERSEGGESIGSDTLLVACSLRLRFCFTAAIMTARNLNNEHEQKLSAAEHNALVLPKRSP